MGPCYSPPTDAVGSSPQQSCHTMHSRCLHARNNRKRPRCPTTDYPRSRWLSRDVRRYSAWAVSYNNE